MAVSYNRSVGLALDADLPLMLRRGPHRLASVLEREATQSLVLMLKHDPKACVSKDGTTIAFGIEAILASYC